MAAPVRILIQFTADSPETADGLSAAMAERCREGQKEPGCIQFETFRSVMRPEVYALVELWESQEALDVHEAGMAPRQPNPAVLSTVSEHYEHKVHRAH